MKLLQKISYCIDCLSRYASYLAIGLVLACALVSVGNALSRYLFDISSNAWLELQWYMFAGIVMLGAAHLLCTNGHIRIDLIYLRLSARQRIYLDLFGLQFFVLPFCIVMMVDGWPWFMEAWAIEERSANAGGLIRWPVKLFIPIGFGLLILQTISECIKRVLVLQGNASLNDSYQRPQQ